MARRTSTASNRIRPTLSLIDQVLFPGMTVTLLVHRTVSIRAIRSALASDSRLITTHECGSSVATLAEVQIASQQPDGTYRVILMGLSRFDTKTGKPIEDDPAQSPLRQTIEHHFAALAATHAQIPVECVEIATQYRSDSQFLDAVASFLPSRSQEKCDVLQLISVESRGREVLRLLKRESQRMETERQVLDEIDTELSKVQRDVYLREQLRVIQKQLDPAGVRESEAIRQKIEESGMPASARRLAESELTKIDQGHGGQEEQIARNYLRMLLDYPWARQTEEDLDIRKAVLTLQECHFGQDQVKERITEFLAVRSLGGTTKGAILCFVGPPGVGKTSMARSIAKALGREFASISLSGMRDASELRGHRRTYVGARPGRIVQEIMRCGVSNPVILLDEVDKMQITADSDPTHGLLELLDPSQNTAFVDHYLEAPIDLSSTIFVITANQIDQLSQPLRDRMELIEFEGYSPAEKLAIADKYLVPNVAEETGLKSLNFATGTLEHIIHSHSLESGVRQLKLAISTIARKAATQRVLGKSKAEKIEIDSIDTWLSICRIEDAVRHPEVGTVYGLAITPRGGEIMMIEVATSMTAQPTLKLTGLMGQSMRESVETAQTAVQTMLSDFRDCSLHVHLPNGAISKDGPSAGIGIGVGIVSSFRGVPVRADIAMSGELTLHGQVIAVGGLREKLLAAHRHGFKEVLYPKCQTQEVREIAGDLCGMILTPIQTLAEAIERSLDYAQTVSIR